MISDSPVMSHVPVTVLGALSMVVHISYFCDLATPLWSESTLIRSILHDTSDPIVSYHFTLDRAITRPKKENL